MAANGDKEAAETARTEQTVNATEMDGRRRDYSEVRLRKGEQIGRYLVLEKLGAGGMGVVFTAYDPELDRKVALKLLHSNVAGASSSREGHDRLVREAQALARVQHPNVVTVHDVGEHEGRVFLAMEFVEGETLRYWLESPRELREILATFIATGRGLEAAHNKGLVHRDFKPDNVMVAEGRPRVMDFGLARPSAERADPVREELHPTKDALGSQLTVAGGVVGTPAYMAPEQHFGHQVGAAADQFAFCVSLYEALYGQRPFRGETMAALAFNVCEGKVEEAPRGRGVPARLRRILLRGLRVEPTQRWPSMQDLLAELGRDPSARRRALGLVGVLALGGVGVVGWQSWSRDQALAACADEAATMQDEWNSDAAERVGAAARAAGVVYAEDTYELLVPWLDRYSESWTQAREEVCRGAIEGDGLGEVLRDRAVECLELQRARLSAFVARLSAPDTAALQTAVASAARLPAPETCRDPAVLSRLPEIPAAHRSEIFEIRRELARATVQLTTSDLDAAQTALHAARARAEEIDYVPVIARAVLSQGLLAIRRGDYGAALDHLSHAHELAGRSGADDTAADAAMALVSVAALQRRPRDAEPWTRIAGMWLDRMQAPQADLRRVDLLTRIAGINDVAGNHKANLPLQAGIVASLRSLLGEEHPDVATALRQLALTHERIGEYADALELHERARASLEQTLGPTHPGLSTVVHSIGLANHDLGRHDEAEKHYRLALKIIEDSLGPEHPAAATTRDSLGTLYLAREDHVGAERHFQRALEITQKALGDEHPDVAGTLSNLAIVARRQGDLDRALELNQRSLEIRETAFGPDHPTVAISLANIGNLHLDRGEVDEALEHYLRAHEIWKQKLGADHPRIALVLRLQCEARLRKGDSSAALRDCERSLTLLDAPDRDPGELAKAQALWARVAIEAGGDRDRAVELTRRAREFFAGSGRAAEVDELDSWLASIGEKPGAP